LGKATVFYSYDLADDVLYKKETLAEPIAIDKALRENPSSGLLIFSDGGAARSTNMRRRIRQTKEFLKRIGHVWSPITWVNPMPSSRWEGTAAAKIAQFPTVSMFELNEDDLINAIDTLRGK